MLHLISNLLNYRKKQLEEQKDMDNKLKSAREKCPQVLIDFFLLERAINRKQCNTINASSILDYPKIIGENLTMIEKRNSELKKILEGDNICDGLRRIINQ